MLALLLIPGWFAGLSMIGWMFHIQPFKGGLLPGVTMNPVTATGVLLLCAAVLTRRLHGRTGSILAGVLVIGPAAFGAVKLADIVGNLGVNLDTWLFHAATMAQPGGGSHMAPNTAVCLLASAIGLFLIGAGGGRRVMAGQIAMLLTALPPMFALLGYLYGVPDFYRISVFIPMAIPTGLSFLGLCAYAAFATRDVGLMAPLFEDGPGGRVARRLIPFGVAMPAAVGWLCQQGERSGLYGAASGVALIVSANMLSFTALVWQNARTLSRAEQIKREADRRLAYAATHDFLTGLPNRALFMERLASRFAAHRRRPEDLFGIVYLDVDNFKQVNDRLGHEMGDSLLVTIAEVLRSCVRADDVVARLGGDEFTILLERIAGTEDFAEVAARILAQAPRSVGPPGQEIAIGMSLGLVRVQSRHLTAQALLRDADSALYQAKREGKGRAAVFLDDAPQPLAQTSPSGR